MNLKSFDFAKGTKSITGLIVMVISLYATQKGLDVDLSIVESTLTEVMLAVGTIYAAFGFFMKLLRK